MSNHTLKMLEQKTQREKVELRVKSFITKNQYDSLLKYLNSFAEFINKDNIVIYDFSHPNELKIQKDSSASKISVKKGGKETLNVSLKKEEFDDLVDVFESLGFDISLKWFKAIHQFKWNEIDITVSFIRGYGYVVEMFKSAYPEEKEILFNYLRENMKLLGLEETQQELFDERLKYYQENWKDLV